MPLFTKSLANHLSNAEETSASLNNNYKKGEELKGL